MIRVSRELIYSNGKITVANTLDKIEIIVHKDNKIVDSKSYPLNMGDNKEMLDDLINTLKGRHVLLYIDDDCTKVLSNSNKRYTIRGKDSCIHVLYRNDGSGYMKQAVLPYDYNTLSFRDYTYMFGIY